MSCASGATIVETLSHLERSEALNHTSLDDSKKESVVVLLF